MCLSDVDRRVFRGIEIRKIPIALLSLELDGFIEKGQGGTNMANQTGDMARLISKTAARGFAALVEPHLRASSHSRHARVPLARLARVLLGRERGARLQSVGRKPLLQPRRRAVRGGRHGR